MRYRTEYLSKATDKQIALIRYLESEFDTPIRLSYETLSSYTKADAGRKIRDLYTFHDTQVKAKQATLF